MSKGSKSKGLIMVNTGDGKGKSTAAFGLALRALGHDMRVCIISFMKGDLSSGELRAFRELLPMVRFEPTGTADFVDRDNPAAADLDEAARGMKLAAEAFAGEYDMVILDEINVAVDFGLVSLEALLRLLESKPPAMHVVLTGRSAAQRVLDIADTVSIIEEGKHHFYKGIAAQPGIEH